MCRLREVWYSQPFPITNPGAISTTVWTFFPMASLDKCIKQLFHQAVLRLYTIGDCFGQGLALIQENAVANFFLSFLHIWYHYKPILLKLFLHPCGGRWLKKKTKMQIEWMKQRQNRIHYILFENIEIYFISLPLSLRPASFSAITLVAKDCFISFPGQHHILIFNVWFIMLYNKYLISKINYSHFSS